MQNIAAAVASERARLKAEKAASAQSAAEEAITSDEAESSPPTAEAYFHQRISESNEGADRTYDSFQAYCSNRWHTCRVYFSMLGSVSWVVGQQDEHTAHLDGVNCESICTAFTIPLL